MTTAIRRRRHLGNTPYYHCIVRCVRNAYLCGEDKATGANFDHRKQWIEQHLTLLPKVFCIDIAGYAIMPTQYHVVLRLDRYQAKALSDDQVIKRWRKLYKGPKVITHYVNGDSLTRQDTIDLTDTVALWRDHLVSISRFMSHLNTTIARRANMEDGCKGHFWESPFKMEPIHNLGTLQNTLSNTPFALRQTNKTRKQKDSGHIHIKTNNKKHGGNLH